MGFNDGLELDAAILRDLERRMQQRIAAAGEHTLVTPLVIAESEIHAAATVLEALVKGARV